MDWYFIALICIAAYLIGAINFATIIAKAKHMNIKKVGSGNPGTMNVLRSVGKVWGVLTFILDALKGVIAALVGRYLINGIDNFEMLFLVGLFAIIGHIFPIYSKFKGGKGVATSMGVLMVACTIVGPITIAVLILFLTLYKYGFVGSILAITFLSIYCSIVHKNSIIIIVICVIIWVLVTLSHRSNIKRLIKGEENTLNLIGKNEVKNLDEENIVKEEQK